MGLIKYWTEKQTNLKTLFSSKQKKKNELYAIYCTAHTWDSSNTGQKSKPILKLYFPQNKKINCTPNIIQHNLQ